MRALHILVVDDDDNMLALWCRRLRKHRLTLAHNGQEALALLSADVDVVLSDLEMPILDGLGLLTRVAAQRPNLPRFLCTGSAPEIAEAAVRGGIASRYFAKPSDLREVSAAIDALGEASLSAS